MDALDAKSSAGIPVQTPRMRIRSTLPTLQPEKHNDMKDKQRFQLIDGTFTPSKAGQVLLSLIKSKIDYHSVEKYSNEERFGRDIAHSEKRLHKLRKLNATLKELLALAADEKQNLKIDGWIEISFTKR